MKYFLSYIIAFILIFLIEYPNIESILYIAIFSLIAPLLNLLFHTLCDYDKYL